MCEARLSCPQGKDRGAKAEEPADQTLVQEKVALELEKDKAELGVELDIGDEKAELDAILRAREGQA
jgi:hypothetical protein